MLLGRGSGQTLPSIVPKHQISHRDLGLIITKVVLTSINTYSSMSSLDNLPEELILEIASQTIGLHSSTRPTPHFNSLILTSTRYARILIPFLYDIHFCKNGHHHGSLTPCCDVSYSVWCSAQHWKSIYILDYWMNTPNEWFDNTPFFFGKNFEDDDTPAYQFFLHELIHQGDLEITRLLLEKGVNPEPKAGPQLTPLLLAVFYGRVETCRALLRAGANLFVRVKGSQDRDGDHALMLAVENGNLELVALIVDAFVATGGSVDMIGFPSKFTPLYQAVQNSTPIGTAIVGLLLDHGADILYEDSEADARWCSNSLQMALESGSEFSGMIMLERLESQPHRLQKALTCSMPDGRTLLHTAITRNQWSIARKLIILGSDLLAKVDRDVNCLHLAMREVTLRILPELLQHGPPVWCEEGSKWPRGFLIHHIARKNIEGILLLKQLNELGKIHLDFQIAVESSPKLYGMLLYWQNTCEDKEKNRMVRETLEEM